MVVPMYLPDQNGKWRAYIFPFAIIVTVHSILVSYSVTH